MFSKQTHTLEHLPCQCGKPARMMEVHMPHGVKRYRAEALCCHMQTVLLRTPEAAAYEFGRLRAVVTNDERMAEALTSPEPVAQRTAAQGYNVNNIRYMRAWQ